MSAVPARTPRRFETARRKSQWNDTVSGEAVNPIDPIGVKVESTASAFSNVTVAVPSRPVAEKPRIMIVVLAAAACVPVTALVRGIETTTRSGAPGEAGGTSGLG